MKNYILPRKTLLLWQIRAISFGILLSILMFVSKTIVFLPIRFIWIAVFVIMSISVLTAVFYMPFLFKTCKVILLKQGVVVERGVFFKNTHILPFSKLIYTQSYRSPIARMLGLTAVSLKAARSRVFIPEMNEEDAADLIVALSEGKHHD